MKKLPNFASLLPFLGRSSKDVHSDTGQFDSFGKLHLPELHTPRLLLLTRSRPLNLAAEISRDDLGTAGLWMLTCTLNSFW